MYLSIWSGLVNLVFWKAGVVSSVACRPGSRLSSKVVARLVLMISPKSDCIEASVRSAIVKICIERSYKSNTGNSNYQIHRLGVGVQGCSAKNKILQTIRKTCLRQVKRRVDWVSILTTTGVQPISISQSILGRFSQSFFSFSGFLSWEIHL